MLEKERPKKQTPEGPLGSMRPSRFFSLCALSLSLIPNYPAECEILPSPYLPGDEAEA